MMMLRCFSVSGMELGIRMTVLGLAQALFDLAIQVAG